MNLAEPLWEARNAAGWQELLQVPAVHIYDTIGSTNDVARELAEAGAASLTTVIADHQTSGRGRAGRNWLSTPGSSLLCSIVFRVSDAETTPGAAPVRIGSAVARAIADVADADARVKWPNDVVIPGRGKVAGILCEAVMRQGRAFVIGGIGVNVDAPAADYASLNDVSTKRVARGDLLRGIIAEIKPFSQRLAAPLTAAELSRIREIDILYGQQVVDDNGLAGVAQGVAADGSLLVRTGQGTTAVHNATIRLAGTHEYPGARL